MAPPRDALRLQREIQFALSSDARGRAGVAARHILRCQALERLLASNEPGSGVTLDHSVDDLSACQAVDAASRAQLVPLLRRSLSDGDKGAAESLVKALKPDFSPAAEPEIMAGLRRDALDCHRPSLLELHYLRADEADVSQEMERLAALAALNDLKRRADGEIDPGRKAFLQQSIASIKLPTTPVTPEAGRIGADIQRRCNVAP